MYKETLRGIAGIDLFPVVSLILFLAVFAVVLYRVARMKGAELKRLAALPLDTDTDRAPDATGVRR
jgi:hypothetical protein